MDAGVFGQFGMEGCYQDMILTGNDRLAVESRQNLNIIAEPSYLGGTDEDHYDVFGLSVQIDLPLFGKGIDLPSIGVSGYVDIDKPQRRHPWIAGFSGQHNQTRAGTPDRLRSAEVKQGLTQIIQVYQLVHGGRLTAGDNQALDLIQFLYCFDQQLRDCACNSKSP